VPVEALLFGLPPLVLAPARTFTSIDSIHLVAMVADDAESQLYQGPAGLYGMVGELRLADTGEEGSKVTIGISGGDEAMQKVLVPNEVGRNQEDVVILGRA
jgi:hypothetical protein